MSYLEMALAIWGECDGSKDAEKRDSVEPCVLSVQSPISRTKSPSDPLPAEPYRRPVELASWSIPWRQHWGEIANRLEDEGVPFPESERRAFDLVVTEREAKRNAVLPTGSDSGNAEFFAKLDRDMKRDAKGKHIVYSGFAPDGTPFVRCTDGCEQIRRTDAKLGQKHAEAS